MEEFVFYRETECKVWTRAKYWVEAESMEDAKRILKEKEKAGNLHADDFEYLYETEEETGKEEWLDENNDQFSIED